MFDLNDLESLDEGLNALADRTAAACERADRARELSMIAHLTADQAKAHLACLNATSPSETRASR